MPNFLIPLFLTALLSNSAVFSYSSQSHQLKVNAHLLQNGDIIFRRGTDSISKAIMSGDASANYSHVGLVAIQNDKVFVLHAIPAETLGAKNEVKIEPLSIFISADRAVDVGVFRLRPTSKITDKTEQAITYAHTHIGYPFDFSFDNQDDKALYCTELIWRAYQSAGVEIINPMKLISLPLMTGKIIPPSAIAQASALMQIKITN